MQAKHYVGIKPVVLFFLMIVPFFAKAQRNPVDSSASVWKGFQYKNYRIGYPSSWKMDTSRAMGSDVIFFSPKDSETDKFSENVLIMVQDLAGMGIDLNKYVDISEKQVRDLVTNSSLIESKRISKNGGEFHQILYSGNQGIFHLKTRQYYFIEGDKAYIVSFVSENDKYDSYEEMGKKIMDSFMFLK